MVTVFDPRITTIIFALPIGHEPHILDELLHQAYDINCVHSEAELLSHLKSQSNWLIIVSGDFPTSSIQDLIRTIDAMPDLLAKHLIVWGSAADNVTCRELLGCGADTFFPYDTPSKTFLQYIHDLFDTSDAI